MEKYNNVCSLVAESLNMNRSIPKEIEIKEINLI